ncbi:MAG: hypothetical protein Q9168_001315 [Polycauliona sp. 1 TL-2023]
MAPMDSAILDHLIPRAGSHIKRDNTYDFVTASPPTQTNSAGVHDDGTDFSYFTSVEFGSSGKMMNLLVDTGASNTWVMASDCKSEICAAHNTFGKEYSASLEVSQDEFNLTYGTGSVSGVTATDTVRLAGFSVSLPFGLAHTVSEDFESYPIDGILGLGPPMGKTTDYPTFMETIQKTNALPSKMFGVNLQRSSDGATDGELSFGAPDSTKYEGDLSYTAVIQDTPMWEIPIDEIQVDGNLCALSSKTAIIDTGTSFMLLPPADAKELHRLIPSAQKDGEAFNIPCSSKTPIQLKFSDVLYNISPADYVGSPLSEGSSFANKAKDSSPTSTRHASMTSPIPTSSSTGGKSDTSLATKSAATAVMMTTSAASITPSPGANREESVQLSAAASYQLHLAMGQHSDQNSEESSEEEASSLLASQGHHNISRSNVGHATKPQIERRQSALAIQSPNGLPRKPRTPNHVRFEVEQHTDGETSTAESDEEDYLSHDASNAQGGANSQRAPLLTGIEAPSVTVASTDLDMEAEHSLDIARPKSGMRSAFMNMANSIMYVCRPSIHPSPNRVADSHPLTP